MCFSSLDLLFDLGRPWFIWHQLIYMNPHSVMFEVGMCVMSYTTVLFFEFLPNVLERFNLQDSDQVDQEDLSGADRAGDLALHPAPEFARIALSDHAEQAASVLVHAGAAVLLLWFGGCGRLGDDDLRVRRRARRPSGVSWNFRFWCTLGGALLVALWVNALLRFEDYFHRGMLGQILNRATKHISCGWNWR